MPLGPIGSHIAFTSEGGLAVEVIAAENLAEGELVMAGTVDGKVVKNAVNNDTPLGYVYAAASANASVWIVVAGIAKVLPNAADTAGRGYIIYSSETTAGRAGQSATLPSVDKHNREAGHFIDAGTGAGVLTRALVHFN
jgi:hypothetical protein